MRKERIILLLAALCMAAPVLRGQSLWTSAEMKFGMAKGLSGYVEGEFRTTDGLDGTERWAASAGLDYKLYRWLKMSAGYTYIHRHVESRVTKKGNIVSDYWQPRHRASFALTGSCSWNRFTFSLRERYQYTYRTEQTVSKWDGDDGSAKADELIEAKSRHVLRSRLKAEYNIRKSGFMPFASCELYNSLSDGFATEKTRWTVGTDYKFNKRHSISAFYRYIDRSDDDDTNGHVIGIGYSFKL